MKNWKKYFSIIGIILFFYIIIKIDFMNILKEIKNVDLFYIFVAFIFLVLMLLVQTYKWYIIAVFQGIKIPFIKAFEINIISNFYGFVTPSKAGAVVRSEYLRKYTDNENIGKGLFNFTIDKILDLSSVIFMTILFSFVFKDKLDPPVGLFIALFFSFILVTLFFIKKERSKFVLKFFYRRFISEKYRDKAKITFDSFYENVPKKRYFPIFFMLTLISWILIYAIIYFIGSSLGIELPFFYYLAILPIGTIVAMIPISISGLGTREAALISLFGLFGVEASKVFSMSLINIVIVGIIPSIIGIFLILKKEK